MLESNRSKSKQSGRASGKAPSFKQMLKEPDIRFFYRFVARYDIREKALEVLSAKLRAQRAN
jgi:hypothetical protein